MPLPRPRRRGAAGEEEPIRPGRPPDSHTPPHQTTTDGRRAARPLYLAMVATSGITVPGSFDVRPKAIEPTTDRRTTPSSPPEPARTRGLADAYARYRQLRSSCAAALAGRRATSRPKLKIIDDRPERHTIQTTTAKSFWLAAASHAARFTRPDPTPSETGAPASRGNPEIGWVLVSHHHHHRRPTRVGSRWPYHTDHHTPHHHHSHGTWRAQAFSFSEPPARPCSSHIITSRIPAGSVAHLQAGDSRKIPTMRLLTGQPDHLRSRCRLTTNPGNSWLTTLVNP